MTGKILPLLLSLAAVMAGERTLCAQSAEGGQGSPVTLASLHVPAGLEFVPASLPVPGASSFAAAAALPPVSRQFQAIFAAPCRAAASVASTSGPEIDSDAADGEREPCVVSPQPNSYARFLDAPGVSPLTPAQKGWLAIHDVKDPGNLATIFNAAMFTVALDPHTGYGPGLAGFGRMSMYTLSQDATQEFFSTFVVSSLTHEDPRYHRMPTAGVPRRLLHALAHTVISQSDSGRTMPNFAALSAYPIGAEAGNLYVPGLQTDGRSTLARIVTGYATDPVDNLISEFLPDVARHIHVRVIFAQRLLNQISSDDFVLP